MMHPEVLVSPWSFFEDNSSTFEFDQLDQLVESFDFEANDAYVGGSGLINSLFNTPLDTTAYNNLSYSSHGFMFNNIDNFHYPIEEDTLQLPSLMDYVSMELDDFDQNLGSHQVVDIQFQGYQQESEGTFPSQNLSSEGEYAWSPTPSMKSDLSSTQFQPSLILPHEGMQIDKKVVLPYMLEACGEALEQGHNPQAEEILRSMSHKTSPIAEEPLERLAYSLSQDISNQGDFLKQEANKNFEPAFQALYQGTPHGKFAHFAANSAIIEAIPHDSEVVHIVDFDMGPGVQWPPMIEAIASMKKTLKLTSIKWGEELYECNSLPWNFQEIKRNLYLHARACGLMLKVEEKGMEEMVLELKKMNKKGGRKDFLAFNCMLGLPHMGREKSRRHAIDFLNLININYGNKGIVTFGDGGAFEKFKNGLDFKSFFNGHLVHYKALLQSIQSHFPARFSEARTAIESLFVTPNVSSHGWLKNWEELREDSYLQGEIGLDGCKLSREILIEAKELLKGSEGLYEARIEGQNENKLVLQWNGIQLVRVSTWRN